MLKMDSTKENTPFVIEIKNNYGTTSNTPNQLSQPISSNLFCLHGQDPIKLRGHCHKPRLEGVDIKARKKLIIASVLCVIFMIAEIVGGVLSNSLAIATDAAHLLTDFASFMISLFAIWIAGRPSTQRMSFGWYRAEVIGALASVIMIWVITAILVWLAIERIIKQEYEVNSEIMLITSGLAILVNVIMGWQLHGAGHGHSHGGGYGHSHVKETNGPAIVPASIKINSSILESHVNSIPTKTKSKMDLAPVPDATKSNSDILDSQSSTDHGHRISIKPNGSINENSMKTMSFTPDEVTDKITDYEKKFSGESLIISPIENNLALRTEPENMNVRAAFIHVLGDVVQSIGVFCAALLIYFQPTWAIADPICTFIFSIIVLFTTFAIMKDALLVLMEGTPSNLHYSEVMGIFQEIDGVVRVHNLRIWALSVSKVAVSVHLVIRPGVDPKLILLKANNAVHRKFNFFETTIQIEDFTPDMDLCQQCNLPDS